MHSSTIQTPTSLEAHSAKLIWHDAAKYGVLEVNGQKFRIKVLHVSDEQLKGITDADCAFIAARLVEIMNKREMFYSDGLMDGGFTIHDKGMTTFKSKNVTHNPESQQHYEEIVDLLLAPRTSSHGSSKPIAHPTPVTVTTPTPSVTDSTTTPASKPTEITSPKFVTTPPTSTSSSVDALTPLVTASKATAPLPAVTVEDLAKEETKKNPVKKDAVKKVAVKKGTPVREGTFNPVRPFDGIKLRLEKEIFSPDSKEEPIDAF